LEIYKKLGKEDPDFRATLSVIEERPWTSTPKDAAITKAVYKAVEEVTGRERYGRACPARRTGPSCTRLKGIPVIVIGAGNTYIPHHADEYVDLPELIETAKIYALTSMYFLNEEF
jgi:succinyl-diaminopimelate desuccinylase